MWIADFYANDNGSGQQHSVVPLLFGAYQFNAIAEWIEEVAAPHPGNILWLGHLHPCGSQLCNQTIVVRALERGMCLLCRVKVIFSSEMNLHYAALKPTASTL
jgi:hypothetical protein